jgi:hypothetical protein
MSIVGKSKDGDGDGLANSQKGQTSKGGLKGILKRPNGLKPRSSQGIAPGGDIPPKRRQLFPTYQSTTKIENNLKVDFSPMARMVTVDSSKEMTHEEKADVWWQHPDYEEFRKTARMVAKAMLEGGSEIWLASNQSWQVPNQNRDATLKSAYSLSKSSENSAAEKLNQVERYENMRSKWWCRFGHSRRGLEHIASLGEGRQRQTNIQASVRTVVRESQQQKTYGRQDVEKLRSVSVRYTSWARDLAKAAGAADADAVRTDFDDASRKTREFYLRQFSEGNLTLDKTERVGTPNFIQFIISKHIPDNKFDANTASQVHIRGKIEKKAAAGSDQKPGHPERSRSPMGGTSTTDAGEEAEKQVAKEDSIAKRAAGFANGEEAANMAAVLSGMGPVSKKVATV